jgi:hypothetical protein
MAKVNLGRVIAAGLVAGLLMNVSEFVLHAIVLAADGNKLLADWQALGLHVEQDPKLLMALVGITFVLGILAVWTYAAIRPRFGAGAGTAVIAGVAVWAMSYLYAAVYVFGAVAVYPSKLTWLPAVWSLVEVPIATVVGAWLYRE